MTETPLIGPVGAPGLHVMSINIRRRLGIVLRPADRWTHRAPALIALLRSEAPAVIGMQEALPDQAAAVRDALGPAYRMVGRGREAGYRGEGCPLVIDTRRLELSSWDQAALSDDPATPGSVSWGNRMPRVMVTATLRDRATGARFLMLNTHLDPFSARSRVRAVRAIRERIAEAGLPAVVTGDLNAGASSRTIRDLLADRALVDAWETAALQATPEWGTHAGYRSPRLRSPRIDWLLVTPDVRVTRSAINPRRPRGRWPSDHLPVQSIVIPPVEGALP